MFDFLDKITLPEVIVVAIVLLILFGPRKLPEFAKGLADAVREVVKAFRGDKAETPTKKK